MSEQNAAKSQPRLLSPEEIFVAISRPPDSEEATYWRQRVREMSRGQLEEELHEEGFHADEMREMSDAEARELLSGILLEQPRDLEIGDEAGESYSGFPESSVMVPRPILFPRAELDAAIVRHERMVTDCEAELLNAAGHFSWVSHPLEALDDLAALIVANSDGCWTISMLERSRIARSLRRYRGIYRKLVEDPGAGRLYVVVRAAGAVSLRTLFLMRPERSQERMCLLRDPSSELVAEPSYQDHAELGETIRTWSTMPSGEARLDSVRKPGPPASPAESFDRLLGLYEPRLRRELASLERGQGRACGCIRTSEMFGDSVRVVGRDGLGPLTYGFPRAAAALEKAPPPGWLPVYLSSARHAAIRWLALHDAVTGPQPAPLDETAEPQDLEGTELHPDSIASFFVTHGGKTE